MTALVEIDSVKNILNNYISDKILGIYLFGSIVDGGLKEYSDIDILVVIDKSLTESEKKALIKALMKVSGEIGNEEGKRYIEVTVINYNDINPWRYPPKSEFVYGEWLREDYQNGMIPQKTADSDLTIMLYQARQTHRHIDGISLNEVIPEIPRKDLFNGIKESIPNLIAHYHGDERNVLLTLCRMWLTIDTKEIVSKDKAGVWAKTRVPKKYKEIIELAIKDYLSEAHINWKLHENDVEKTIGFLVNKLNQL
ncbi:aminoglycoside adenylyltransferase family protein [Brevibacillus sp. NRS-1366]|uniref:aminoglycoside adenylyltransferase family protein n=1 Tax=Brevibacillus sp. NRS-1366 TaxID=3233899 RepID=UPI003D244F18